MQRQGQRANTGHPSVLEGRFLGGCELRYQGRVVTPPDFKRRRSFMLLLLLLSVPAHRITRSQLLEQLWPDADRQQSESGLRVVLTDLRAGLNDGDAPSLIIVQGPLVALSSQTTLLIDAERFETAATASLAEHSVGAMRAAEGLYTGSYLPDHPYEDWAHTRRAQLKRLYERLLAHLIELEQQDDPLSAEVHLQALLSVDATHEAAARRLIKLLARQGRRAEAVRVYQTLADALRADLDQEPEQATVDLRRRLLGSAAPPRARDAAPPAENANTTLPIPATNFVERAWELSEVSGLLLHPPSDCRLLTLTGIGGSGKTRLAIEAARTIAHHYPDGIWFVDLAPLADGTLVPNVIGSALGLREEAWAGQAGENPLVKALRHRRGLLMLDNCEHLIDSVAAVTALLLRGCPQLRVLATSREPMALLGEITWLVPPLDMPTEQESRDPTKQPPPVAQYSAIRLFVERARAAKRGFALTDGNAPLIIALCRRLDGIPLAIELAAAQLHTLTLEELAVLLNDRFRGLTTDSRAVIPRQRTLRAVMDWSYSLLEQPARALLQRLSVFAGGWTLEAAEAVCSDGVPADSEVANTLFQLIDKSLVFVEEPHADLAFSPSRYRMLELVRQYAHERLETTSVHWAHAAYFLSLAERAEPELTGSNQVSWLKLLDQEQDNVRAVLSWTVEMCRQVQSQINSGPDGDRTPGCAEIGIRLAGALWRYWLVRGRLTEGSTWLESTLQYCSDDTGPMRGKALNGAGNLVWALGEFQRAVALHTENLLMWQTMGDKKGIASALRNLGNVAGDQGDYARAGALHAESLALSRELGSDVDIASALSNLGNVRKEQGAFEEAQALYEESLALRRTLGDTRGVGMSLANLGNAALCQGQREAARRLFEESLVLRRTLDDKRGIAAVLNYLGQLALYDGSAERASGFYAESLAILDRVGDRRRLAECLEGIARLARLSAQADRATQLRAGATALRETLGSPANPSEQGAIEQELSLLRGALGDTLFAQHWAAGLHLTLDEAIGTAGAVIAAITQSLRR